MAFHFRRVSQEERREAYVWLQCDVTNGSESLEALSYIKCELVEDPVDTPCEVRTQHALKQMGLIMGSACIVGVLCNYAAT